MGRVANDIAQHQKRGHIFLECDSQVLALTADSHRQVRVHFLTTIDLTKKCNLIYCDRNESLKSLKWALRLAAQAHRAVLGCLPPVSPCTAAAFHTVYAARSSHRRGQNAR